MNFNDALENQNIQYLQVALILKELSNNIFLKKITCLKFSF